MDGSIVVQQPILVQRACIVDTAHRDALTGAPVTELVLDPDDLADVNARLGWEAVDELLLELAERLQVRLWPAGITTHLDFEHLCIRCIGLPGERPVATEVAGAVAEPLEVGGQQVEVRSS